MLGINNLFIKIFCVLFVFLFSFLLSSDAFAKFEGIDSLLLKLEIFGFKNYDTKILEEFEKSEWVKVTIQLKEAHNFKINPTDPGKRRDATIKQIEKANAITIESVLSTLSDKEFKKTHIHSLGNGFSGDINKVGFEKLIINPKVEMIYLRRMHHVGRNESIPLIRVKPDVWNKQVRGINIRGSGEAICVLDTGVRKTHQDLDEGKVVAEYCYCGLGTPPGCCPPNNTTTGTSAADDGGHGTHVSGIAAASGTELGGPRWNGVAPDAKIASVKVCDSSGNCDSADVDNGIQWCIDNRASTTYTISVINMSFGDITNLRYNTSAECTGNYTNRISQANSSNIAVVAISHNHAYDNDVFKAGIVYPACATGVIAVGATYDASGGSYTWNPGQFDECTDSTISATKVACFSQVATGDTYLLDILAPGGNISSTFKTSDTSYATATGTSASAPHVAGVAALIKQVGRAHGMDYSPALVEQILESTGVTVTDTRPSPSLNFPRVDALAAINTLYYFRVENATGGEVAAIDTYGNVALKGECHAIASATCANSPPAKSFIVKNASGTVTAFIDQSGNLCIAQEGDCTTPYKTGGACVPDANTIEHLIQRAWSGDTTAFIDENGRLCYEGDLYKNATFP